MHLLAVIIALAIGTLIGLQFPDSDRVFSLLLVHRSIVTHGFILPLGLMLLVQDRARWLRMGAAGLILAVAVHLAFDLFPRQWYGYALITVPFFGRLDSTVSVLWIALSIAVCGVLALRLLRNRTDLALLLAAAGWGFVITMGRERVWLLPLLALLVGLGIAACTPNAVIDGRATIRQWRMARQRRSQP
ncbi:MAG: hypothetical protein HC828_04790 [Blastochloris sp.]|nr:hypothetical protein [Blastochloris sp.]